MVTFSGPGTWKERTLALQTEVPGGGFQTVCRGFFSQLWGSDPCRFSMASCREAPLAGDWTHLCTDFPGVL